MRTGKFLLVLSLSVVYFFCFPGFAAWSSGKSQDYSDLFRELYEGKSSILSQADLSYLRSYKILLIPGYFSDFTIKSGLIGYFQSAKKALQEKGLKEGDDYERLVIKSQSPSYENFEQIKAAILDSPKKLIIIGHSKGSTDSLKTILAYPFLQEKIAGMITIQGPFYGTQVADEILRDPSKRHFFDKLLTLLGGNLLSMVEFSTAKSEEFMKDNATELEQLPFPILNFTSSLIGQEKMTFTILRPFHQILQKQRVQSDGLVPTQHALMSNRPFISYQGLDHTDTVVSFGLRGKRKKLVEGLLKIFLELKLD